MRFRRLYLALGLCVVLSVAGLTGGAVGAPTDQAARDRVGAVVKRTGGTVSVPADASAAATATCRRGETLIGGGAIGEGANFQAVFLRASGPHPNNNRRWLVRGFNNDGANPHDLTAYAMCAKSARRDRVGVIVRERGAKVTLAAGTPESKATAKCRGDERLVNGGAAGTGPASTAVLLKASAPDPAAVRRWLAVGSNNDFVNPQTLRAYAFCARPARPDRVEKIVKRGGPAIEVAPLTSGNVFAKCRRSERLVGGGAFSGGEGDVGIILKSSAPQSNNARQWRATGFNFNPGIEQRFRAFAFCARG